MYFTSPCFEREISNLFACQRYNASAPEIKTEHGLHAIAPIQRKNMQLAHKWDMRHIVHGLVIATTNHSPTLARLGSSELMADSLYEQ